MRKRIIALAFLGSVACAQGALGADYLDWESQRRRSQDAWQELQHQNERQQDAWQAQRRESQRQQDESQRQWDNLNQHNAIEQQLRDLQRSYRGY